MNKEPNIRIEELLLLSLCRLTFNGEQKKRVQELTDKVSDWKYFATLTNEHGLSALAGYNFSTLAIEEKVPADILAQLKNAHHLSLRRNVFLSELLSQVLDLFNNEGIKTVLVKGMALELTEYGNIGLRQMSDIDILIDHKRCIEAWNILLNNGFESLPLKSKFHKPILAYTGKHLPSLIKDGASIEIHHSLFGEKKNDITHLLANQSVKVLLNEEPVFIPTPKLFFLYLVSHLHRHEMNNESQLRLYTDLFILLDKYTDEIIDYDLLELVSKAGLSDILAWKLESLKEFWDLSFPEWVNDFINKRRHPETIDRFLFFLRNPKNNPPLDKSLVYRQIIKDIPGINRKFLFLLGDLFPSLTFMQKRYKCKTRLIAFFYYPLRFGKLLWFIKIARQRP